MIVDIDYVYMQKKNTKTKKQKLHLKIVHDDVDQMIIHHECPQILFITNHFSKLFITNRFSKLFKNRLKSYKNLLLIETANCLNLHFYRVKGKINNIVNCLDNRFVLYRLQNLKCFNASMNLSISVFCSL